jgi:hypothetical protein
MRRMTIATALGQAAWTARRHWRALPPDRRTRLQVSCASQRVNPQVCLRPSDRTSGCLSVN